DSGGTEAGGTGAGGTDAGAEAAPVSCDGTGSCNVMETIGCVPCAYQTVCKSFYDACQANADCQAYIACHRSCDGLDPDAGMRCADQCETDHQIGSEQFFRPMAKCAFCDACKQDCALPPTASLCQ